MDTYRGNFVDNPDLESGRDYEAESYAKGSYDGIDDEAGSEMPPAAVSQDERRMQVRAYNHWASLLGDRNLPAIDGLDITTLPDFAPFSVLLDFTGGADNPTVLYLGVKLAEECGTAGAIRTLADVPKRSLLSRITDHYMQILAHQAPIGFEAEFVNQRERTILYRGILLPFSNAGETIDFIYGVINWKELADAQTSDELLLEIDQALGASPVPESAPVGPREPLTEWADGPADFASVLDLVSPLETGQDGIAWPAPAFGTINASLSLDDAAATQDMPLADWLASARELAQAARGSEDRTRQALYAAIGRAYDFSLAAAAAPEEFDRLVRESGLTIQVRAPLTPLVKLVFGADYDKTRLTEYAAALGHAHRLGIARGALTGFLVQAAGGLKGVVAAERRLRRADGNPVEVREAPAERLARKLRRLEPRPLDAVATVGSEFTVLLARRLANGEVVLLGEVADDIPLLERAARRLLG